MKTRVLVLSFVLVAAAAAATVFAWPRGRTAVTFPTIPAAKLALAGVTLTAPIGSTPSVSAGEAAAAEARKHSESGRVLEYRYAHCVDTQVNPDVDEDCWAVSLDPSGLRAAGPVDQKASYDLVLIDPSTDKLILAADGG